MIYFRLAADADQFLTIAKFRALRKLWARVEEACGLAPRPAFVAAETAWRMMTRRDPYVNILRTTIAVFAAGLGGADAITVLPFTAALGLPDAFARRIARNTQLILLEESNLAKVADPAAGSGGDRGFDRAALRRGLGAVSGDRGGGRRRGGARERPHPAQGRRRPRRARSGRRAAARTRSPAPAIFPISTKRRSRCSRRRRRAPPRRAGASARAAAGDPPCRAVRSVARCLRPRCWPRPARGRRFPRQSRHARRLHRARDLRQEFLRGRRHRGGRQRRIRRATTALVAAFKASGARSPACARPTRSMRREAVAAARR